MKSWERNGSGDTSGCSSSAFHAYSLHIGRINKLKERPQ